jgi:predicted ester cyclase
VERLGGRGGRGEFAPGFAFRGSLGRLASGRDGWRAYRDVIRRGAPEFHDEVVDLVADGDRAAARPEFPGTHLGPLLALAPTGRRFVRSGAAFFTADDGLLTGAWVLGGIEALRAQLT